MTRPGVGPLRYSGTFPAEAEAVGRLRNEVVEAARTCGFSPEVLSVMRSALSEVATNAVIHAYRASDATKGEIRVEMFLGDEELLIVVADDGDGVSPRLESPGLGLGLPVVAALTRRFELISPESGGTEAHLAFDLPSMEVQS